MIGWVLSREWRKELRHGTKERKCEGGKENENIYKEKWRGRENQKQKKKWEAKKVKKTTHTGVEREHKDGRMEGQEGEGDLDWWVLEVFM